MKPGGQGRYETKTGSAVYTVAVTGRSRQALNGTREYFCSRMMRYCTAFRSTQPYRWCAIESAFVRVIIKLLWVKRTLQSLGIVCIKWSEITQYKIEKGRCTTPPSQKKKKKHRGGWRSLSVLWTNWSAGAVTPKNPARLRSQRMNIRWPVQKITGQSCSKAKVNT
jgi:hypothetical protein